ncbi:MAG: hypothetical protein R3Y59_09090 [bacterium]
MKTKKLIMMIVAVCAITLTACTSKTDSLINKYEKALKNKNYEKALTIAAELEPMEKELSKEQLDRLYKIAETYSEEISKTFDLD